MSVSGDSLIGCVVSGVNRLTKPFGLFVAVPICKSIRAIAAAVMSFVAGQSLYRWIIVCGVFVARHAGLLQFGVSNVMHLFNLLRCFRWAFLYALLIDLNCLNDRSGWNCKMGSKNLQNSRFAFWIPFFVFAKILLLSVVANVTSDATESYFGNGGAFGWFAAECDTWLEFSPIYKTRVCSLGLSG